MRGYISLTCHAVDNEWVLRSIVLSTVELIANHTADSISDAFLESMFKWGIQNKVIESTTDSARNITNAMKNLNIFNIPCVGHTLQLSVLKSFELRPVMKMLAKVQKIVGHFHRSEKATCSLHEKQNQLRVSMHKFINDCVTGWGSTCSMLSHFIEQQQSVCAVFLKIVMLDNLCHLMKKYQQQRNL